MSARCWFPAPLLALAVACSGDAVAPPDASPGDMEAALAALPPEINREIAALRRATAAFQQYSRAYDAGYDTQFPEGCMEIAEGAQGYHYIDFSLVGTLDVEKPQLLMYEPQANGRLNLVGVEYIFPGEPTDPPPTLFGREFGYSDVYGVWILHVWAWRGNPHPDGIFANWNPLVSCRHATLVATAAPHH